MKDLSDFRAELEESLTWRLEEYYALKNLIKNTENFSAIKTLVVMLYAHFEGFVKDALGSYVGFINSMQEKRQYFTPFLIAASMQREYAAFEDTNRKCKLLSTTPPLEAHLHRYHRRVELSQFFSSGYVSKTLRIDEKIINTQSNLNYSVLQENFYVLGLDYNAFHDNAENIDKLVNLRNSVAHGSQRNPIEITELEKLETSIISIMKSIITYLYAACVDESYKCH